MLIRPPRALPAPALVAALAALLALCALPVVTSDMREFLVPWFGVLVAKGPVQAFAEPFSNYMPAYLYLLAAVTPLAGSIGSVALIKLVSIAGTIALMLAVRALLAAVDAPQPTRAATLLLLLPSAIINAALLGQCDALWAAPVLMALASAQRRRHGWMLAWYGLAIAVKAQAALAAPIILALLIARRVPMRLWPIAPLAALATLVPAALAGWPIADLLTVYLRQADYFPYIAMNAPNIWLIARGFAGPVTPGLTALALTAAVGTGAAFVAWGSTRRWQGRDLVAAALLCTLLTAGLLPRMHERYFFLADVLALALALVRRDREGWWIAGLVQAGSCLALLAYFVDTPQFAISGAIAMLWATFRVARPLLAPASNDNAPFPHRWRRSDAAWPGSPVLVSSRIDSGWNGDDVQQQQQS